MNMKILIYPCLTLDIFHHSNQNRELAFFVSMYISEYIFFKEYPSVTRETCIESFFALAIKQGFRDNDSN